MRPFESRLAPLAFLTLAACGGGAATPPPKDGVTVVGTKSADAAMAIHAESYAFQKDFGFNVLIDAEGFRASPFYGAFVNGLKTPCYRDTLAVVRRIAFGAVLGDKTAVMAGEFANEEEAKKAFSCLGGSDEKAIDENTGAVYLRRGLIVIAVSPEVLSSLKPQEASILKVNTSTFAAARYGETPSEDNPVVGRSSVTLDDKGIRVLVDAQILQSELMPALKAQFDKWMTEPLPETPALRALGERLRAGTSLKTNGTTLHGELNIPGDRAATAKFGKEVEFALVAGIAEYMNAAKQAEAKNALGQMARGVVSGYEREEYDPKNPKKSGHRKIVCISSEARTPAAVPKGIPYASTATDWSTPFWQDLRFEMTSPQYFSYSAVAAKDGQKCTLIAEGDLNGDGKTSRFELVITRDAKSDSLKIAPQIVETNPNE